MENETLSLLMNRKSVRAYEDGTIPETDVRSILEAAVQAPTAGNMTLWSCIRVTEPELKEALAEHCDHQPMIARAPLVLVFYADYHRWLQAFHTLDLGEPIRKADAGDRMLAVMDATIACHAAVTAAESLGYGTCYIGDVIENWEWHRKAFHLPEHVQPAAMAIIGVPTQQQIDRRKPARFKGEDVCFENSYQDGGAAGMLDMLRERQADVLNPELPFETWLERFTRRKWNCAFSEEMSRSAQLMLNEWQNSPE